MPKKKNRLLEKPLSPFAEIPFQDTSMYVDPATTARRTGFFVAITTACILLAVVLLSSSWTGSFDHFMLLEFSSAIVAYIVGAIALIKFYTRNKSMYLLIGVGFLGAAFFETLQTIATNTSLLEGVPFVPHDFMHTWTSSRAFLAMLLLGSWFIWRLELEKQMSLSKLYTVTAMLGAFSGAFLLLYPKCLTLSIVIITISIFILTTAGYMQKQYWKWKYFEYFLILTLIVSVFSELFRISSTTPYDPFFIGAYVLKLLSYALALFGLLMSMYKSFTEVEEARDKINVILRSIGEGVFVTDKEGTIVLLNRIAEELSGFKLKHAQQKHYCDVFRFFDEDGHQEPFVDFVENVLKSGKHTLEYPRIVLEQSSGVRIPVSISTAPVVDRNKKVFGCIVVFHNVTKERELEKMKDNFLSVAAHQLRAPLGAMRWNMEMIMSGDVGKISEPLKQNVSQLQENNQRLILLVNDLLNVSRIDQKRVHDRPIPTNLFNVICRVVEDMQQEAYTKNLTIAISPKHIQLPEIMIDPSRVQEVLENLLSNAIKYNRIGGKISIKITKEKHSLDFEISDTGMGIPKKDQKHLFSKYFRATNARVSAADGSGLGLFVVKSYVESWGGRVSCKRVEGAGTTICISIPKEPKRGALGIKLFEEKKAYSRKNSGRKG